MGEGSRYFISHLWQSIRSFGVICILSNVYKTYLYIFFLDNKDGNEKIDYPNENRIVLNETWMTLYLEKEQQMNMKRLDQQETLLNITERLLDKLHNELD